MMTEQPDIELDETEILARRRPSDSSGDTIVLPVAAACDWIGALVVRVIRHPRDREGTDR